MKKTLLLLFSLFFVNSPAVLAEEFTYEEGHKKIGGRTKGTPNKITLIRADDLLLELDVNPIQKLIEIAESDEASLDQKINCYKEIAKYTYPRLKLQELWVSPVENLAPTVIKLVAGKI